VVLALRAACAVIDLGAHRAVAVHPGRHPRVPALGYLPRDRTSGFFAWFRDSEIGPNDPSQPRSSLVQPSDLRLAPHCYLQESLTLHRFLLARPR
jgi:hypothetical protein